MAVNNDPVFGKSPNVAHAACSAANTNLDGSGTIITLLTTGADGAILTSLEAWATATNSGAARMNMFISTDGGSTWKLHKSGLMAAYTVAATTVQTPVTLVDKTDPYKAVLLPPSAKVGVASMDSEAVVFCAEYQDLS
jgi:hypothetical protein